MTMQAEYAMPAAPAALAPAQAEQQPDPELVVKITHA